MMILITLIFISNILLAYGLYVVYKKYTKNVKYQVQTDDRDTQCDIERLIHTMRLLNNILINKYTTQEFIEVLDRYLMCDIAVIDIIITLRPYAPYVGKQILLKKADALYKKCSERVFAYIPMHTIIAGLREAEEDIAASNYHGICNALTQVLGYASAIHIFPELRKNSSLLKKHEAAVFNVFWWEANDPRRIACIKELREIYTRKAHEINRSKI